MTQKYPNLACMKISGYFKKKRNMVRLLTDYLDMKYYDQVYISKVFTDTRVPPWVLMNAVHNSHWIHLGGTGFYFDKAEPLPDEIEHHMPDYRLYDQAIEARKREAKREAKKAGKEFNEDAFYKQYVYYRDYSYGFMTRGCFRKCPFCVNKKYDRVVLHSPLEEFYDPSRKKICLLDDNVFGCPQWREVFESLKAVNKPFIFKQGLDERLLTDEKAEMLFSCKYDRGHYVFAFDNIADYDLIEEKLQIIRRHSLSTSIKFYVLVGFESTDLTDIVNMLRRVALLMKYGCTPYIMRYRGENGHPWEKSEYRDMYVYITSWCNSSTGFRKLSFRQYCNWMQKDIKTEGFECAALRTLKAFEAKHPEIAAEYFDLSMAECYDKETGKPKI